MKRLAHIAVLVVVTLLMACGNKEIALDTEPLYTPRYAQGFSIERDKQSGDKYLVVKNPWQGAERVAFYTKLDTVAPPKRIVAMSSSHSAMLEAVECTDRIVGLSGCQFVYSPALRQAIEKGQICEVGYDSNFDFERIVALNADLALLYGVTGEAKGVTDKLDELAIPYIYIGDYLENSPLGKAEWVVALASLCGVEKQGKDFFAGVEERYNTLRNKKHCSAYRPRVMLNTPYRDTWFMPPHNSYMVQLIEDAGGEYVLTENGKRKTENEDKLSTTSKPISLEEALEYALQADFWLNLGQIASIEELRCVTPHFTNIDAVRFGRIYNNTKRTNESRGSDFWESGAVRPDVILADLVKILHYEAPTDSLCYYKRLQ
ncbi:MAG: ABC transporter substrate-binding protein [Alistipes sp.]|nr:ABC transporter substrate-binding protein [Alistipes sp.]